MINDVHVDDALTQAEPKDLIKFFSMLMTESRFRKNTGVFVNSIGSTPDPTNKNMITIVIKFQLIDKKGPVTLSLQSWEWQCFRAKNFCCSNTGFRQILPDPYPYPNFEG